MVFKRILDTIAVYFSVCVTRSVLEPLFPTGSMVPLHDGAGC